MYRPAITSAVFLERVRSLAAEMQQLPHDAKEGALLEDVARGRVTAHVYPDSEEKTSSAISQAILDADLAGQSIIIKPAGAR